MYRCTKLSDPINKYLGKNLILAAHVDYEDLISHSIEFKSRLDLWADRLKQICVVDIPLYDEAMHTYDEIYCDEDIIKAQLIENVPLYVWKLEPNGQGGFKCTPKTFFNVYSTHYWKIDEIDNFISDLFEYIFNDDDLAFMNADIKAAYEGHLFFLEPVNDTPMPITYSKEFLEKWHNSAQLGYYPGQNPTLVLDWEVNETVDPHENGRLQFDPTIKALDGPDFVSARRGAGNRYIDFYDREVTPDQIMNATRWLFSLKVDDEAAYTLKFDSLPSQIIATVFLYKINAAGDALQVSVFNGSIPMGQNSDGYIITKNTVDILTLLAKWNYAPLSIVMLNYTSVAGQRAGFISVAGDLGNYTVISKRVLFNMNNLANYTLMGAQKYLPR